MGTPVVMLDVDVAALQESAVQAAVRGAFAQLAAGRAVQPQQVVTELPGGGDVIAYQGVLADDGVYAVKVSPYLPQPAGKPVVTAWTLLLSTLTGEPLAARGCRCADRRADRRHHRGGRRPARARRRVHGGRHRVGPGGAGPPPPRPRRPRPHRRPGLLALDDGRRPRVSRRCGWPRSADEAAAGADVVLLCTSAAAAVVDVRRLAPGTLVTSVSTNAPMAHEIDPAALAELDVYADHAPAAFAAAGEMRIAAAEHGFTARPGARRPDEPARRHRAGSHRRQARVLPIRGARHRGCRDRPGGVGDAFLVG